MTVDTFDILWLVLTISTQFEALSEIHPDARYYRLADNYENLANNEVKCPSDKDKITCAKCGLCSGTKLQAKSVVIIEE